MTKLAAPVVTRLLNPPYPPSLPFFPVPRPLPCRVPPPHLSPFVDHKEEGYLPDYAATIQRLKSAAAVASEGGTAGGLLEWEGARERRVEEDGTMVAAARFEEDEEKVEAARLKQVGGMQEVPYCEMNKWMSRCSDDH